MEQVVMTFLRSIFVNSVTKLKPKNLITRNVEYDQRYLTIFDDKFDLKNKNVYVVGAGKAVLQMGTEIENILGNKISTGIVNVPWGITKKYPISSKSIIQYIEGAENNVADERSMLGARKIKNLVQTLKEDSLLLVLLSGGGSALLPDPIHPITLEEKSDLIKRLSFQGADIKELNTVRKRLSSLKGGKLAILSHPAEVVTLLISDIVGVCEDMVASGPTFENNDRSSDALSVVQKYLPVDEIPKSILNILNSNVENCKESWNQMKISNYVLGNNVCLVDNACTEAQDAGYSSHQISHIVSGNVNDVATDYFHLVVTICNLLAKSISRESAKNQLKSLRNVYVNTDTLEGLLNVTLNEKGVCLIAGGEPVVQVSGTGKGGRNQHLALEFSNQLNLNKSENGVLDKFNVYLLSGGTDGMDGPTDAAGAIGYSNLVDDALSQDLNVNSYLENYDSYSFYSKFRNGECHVKIGHTSTNVMDIHVIVIELKK